jgi:carbonic anhydrase
VLIHKTLDISINIHGSKHIAVVGHYDCAGNPVSKEIQLVQIQESVEYVKSLYPELDVFGLWVNENWEVEEL